MDLSPPLLDCAFLPYILSLLDDPNDVFRCMLVCRPLYDVIKENYHMMKKPMVSVSILCDPVKFNEEHFRINVYEMSKLVSDSTALGVNGSTQDTPTHYYNFCLSFLKNGTITAFPTRNNNNICFLPMPIKNILRERAVMGSTTQCFKVLLTLIFTNYEVYNLDTGLYTLSRDISTTLKEIVRTTGLKSGRCNICSTSDWDLPVLLESETVYVNVIRSTQEQESVNLLQMDFARLYLGWIWDTITPLESILKEWNRGDREILDIDIFDMIVTLPTVVDLLRKFHVHFINQNPEAIIGTIKRRKHPQVLYFDGDFEFGSVDIHIGHRKRRYFP